MGEGLAEVRVILHLHLKVNNKTIYGSYIPEVLLTKPKYVYCEPFFLQKSLKSVLHSYYRFNHCYKTESS